MHFPPSSLARKLFTLYYKKTILYCNKGKKKKKQNYSPFLKWVLRELRNYPFSFRVTWAIKSVKAPCLSCFFPTGMAWWRKRINNRLFLIHSNNRTFTCWTQHLENQGHYRKERFEILVPRGRVSFHQNPLIFHATQLPCYKPADWENIFLSVEAKQRRKSKTKKRKQSFAVFFIVPFTLTFYFCVDCR